MTGKQALARANLGCGVLVFTVVTASASIVCSGNVCWHVTERYDYPPSAGVVVHEDSWKVGPGISFREHDGRGYWKGETWTTW